MPQALIAQLSDLVLTTETDLADTDAICRLIEQHKLEPEFLLHFERDMLHLCKADAKGRFDKQQTALNVASVIRRAGSATELHRACLGGTAGDSMQVLDLFAGWGMDAFALAASGATLTCVEFQPAMVALLRDATRRVAPQVSDRLSVTQGDALAFLQAQQSNVFDVVYLDPMFPARNKGALPNKNLQWLAQLTADDARTDSVTLDVLINMALSKANKQVVLKRRRKDPVVGTPDRQIAGSSVRYDIYS